MKRRSGILLMLIAIVVAMTSCEHKDLCYHHPHTARVRIDVDWAKYSKDTPSGMSVLVYDHEGAQRLNLLSNTITHVYADLEAGTYHSIAFNQSPSEYGSVTFKYMDDYNRARVLTNKYLSRWYVARRGSSDEVAEQPEWIGADRQEYIEVTPDMVEATSGYMTHEKKSSGDIVVATHYPLNIIHTLIVRIDLKGIKNLRSARASLDGLAEGYIFSLEQPTSSNVTQLLETWRLSTDKNSTKDDDGNPVDGYITTTITFFGLPMSHQGIDEENYLYLSLLLVDNETQINVPFFVGDKFERDPVLENTWYLNLTYDDPLPDVAPESGTGAGFEATVDDWEEGEDITVGV